MVKEYFWFMLMKCPGRLRLNKQKIMYKALQQANAVPFVLKNYTVIKHVILYSGISEFVCDF